MSRFGYGPRELHPHDEGGGLGCCCYIRAASVPFGSSARARSPILPARGPTPWNRTRTSRVSGERADQLRQSGMCVRWNRTQRHVINSSVVMELGSPDLLRTRQSRARHARWRDTEFRTQESNLDRAVQSRVSCRLDESGSRHEWGVQESNLAGRTRRQPIYSRFRIPTGPPPRGGGVRRRGAAPREDGVLVASPRSARAAAESTKGHRSPGGPRCRGARGRSTADGPRGDNRSRTKPGAPTRTRSCSTGRRRMEARAARIDCCGVRYAWRGILEVAWSGYVRAVGSVWKKSEPAVRRPARRRRATQRSLSEECNRW